MAGTKRSWEGLPLRDDPKSQIPTNTMAEPATHILSMFGTFRDELDGHHDRRERLIKTSRDITALSKKMVRATNTPIPPSIAKETQSRFTQILELFRAVVPDVKGLNSWRYLRQLSPGIQEFIEAFSFHHYLQTQTVITLEQVSGYLPREILVTDEDYMMGLFDLTGEIMRFAVTSLSAGGHTSSTDAETESELGLRNLPRLPASQAGVVRDLREMRAQFKSLSIPRRHNMLRDFGKKEDVMQTSVEKVERAAYGILVRGSERPAGWAPDLSAPIETEIY
ncbi:hypothetical protein ARAM_004270 [Aspergillus rambellii]|uniref:Translin-associated factor TraX n=1 Tax=Aspergillus rambellii TaxID=308745 RepID=A0A0F8X721_9EURO|nr:hypothetical protein ARAM_004270 [Aspergillus rambellii]